MHKSWDWLCELLGGVWLAFFLKDKSHVYRGWPAVHITNGQRYHNNDTFAPHSAPLALTTTITMDRQR